MSISPIELAFTQALNGPARRMVVIRQAPFLFAAVNDNNRAALFIRVSLSPTQVVGDGHGFSVTTMRSGDNDYVQITATDPGLPSLFLKLVEYLLERVLATDSIEDGVKALTRSIEEYRRFVSHRRGRLSESAVRGAFAELLFLRLLLVSGMSPAEGVASWRGPWARAGLGVHDFSFPDGRGIEVKSTHQPPGSVRVSSPEQLAPSDRLLDLLVLPLESAPESISAGIAFRQLALDLQDAIYLAGPAASEMWDAALEALGLNLGDEWYDRYRFLPGEWARFVVSSNFPCLDVSSLSPGISDIRYSLELSTIAPFSAPIDELLSEICTP